MPFYEYYCSDCEKTFNVFHSMNKEYEGTCDFCKSENIERVVAKIGDKVDQSKFKKKVGDLVKSHIESSRSEIKKEKQRLRNKEYE